jgi:hypothetical protein
MLRRQWILGGLVLVALVGSARMGQAAVNVGIGISLPAAPRLLAVPGVPVSYAPSVPGNYFVYGGQYYVFANDVWYLSPGYQGPWTALSPVYVPRPLLAVPVQYYHTRPAAWKQWRREAPPRWAGNWGREWQEREVRHGRPWGEHRSDRDRQYDRPRDDRR